jgi:hypothetical protein
MNRHAFNAFLDFLTFLAITIIWAWNTCSISIPIPNRDTSLDGLRHIIKYRRAQCELTPAAYLRSTSRLEWEAAQDAIYLHYSAVRG